MIPRDGYMEREVRIADSLPLATSLLNIKEMLLWSAIFMKGHLPEYK
jgi:hypothetical protein